MSHRKGTYTKQNAAAELLAHLQSLGLETPEDYRQWCVENGFRTSFRKSRFQRHEELLYFRRQMAVNCLRQRKQEQRSIVDRLDAVCSVDAEIRSIPNPTLRNILKLYVIQRGRINRSGIVRTSFLKLISQLYRHQSKLLAEDEAMYEWNNYATALVSIATKARWWIRPVETWRPRGRNRRLQLASLLRHLFVKYQMPLFFDSVWLTYSSPKYEICRDWYLDVGLGRNIRHCQLPIPYTKKMAHYFMQGPRDLTFFQALRWGQIRGLGGDIHQARAILSTRLASGFSRDEFWTSVIYWLIHHSQLDRRQIRLLIDYFIFQRYGVSPEEYDDESAPVNEYCMKGRTVQSLMRDATEWYLDQENRKRIPEHVWEPSGLPEFDYRDEGPGDQTGKRWVIRELLNSYELDTEGNQMNHCVGSYADSCAGGECSIWSMQIELQQGFKKAITIEVRKEDNLINEVRGKANRLPNPRERNVLRRWAETAGLKFSRYLYI